MPENRLANIKAEDLDRVEKRVHEVLSKYHNCAQCTLLAIQEVSGLKDDLLAKTASCLSGGVGGLGSICGALTGAILALGIKYGRDVSMLQGPPEKAIEASDAVHDPVLKLAKWFEREFGSINCLEIRKSFGGTDLSRLVPWQEEWMNELGIHERCTEMAAKTARRALVMLDNPDLSILDRV